MSPELDPEEVSSAPVVTAVEGLMLEVQEDSGTEYMPALQIHLLSAANDAWVQTVLVNRSMVERLRDNVLPSLVAYLDDHTPEDK